LKLPQKKILMMKRLPEKTIERLSIYRRTLLNCLDQGRTHIYSHELAYMHNITAVQVRRDIMFMGYASSQKKGYDVKELIKVISRILDSDKGNNVAIIGMGNLGRAITSYFVGKRPKLNIVAAFDNDLDKIGRVISGVKCHDVRNLSEMISNLNITIAILTVPTDYAVEIADKLLLTDIKGLLNFTSIRLNIPPHICLEEYDMITSLEKVAYMVNRNN
jgi:redox-sensing transcriptional repressor